jgi:antitoxin component of RelBE/YafQ-DinJ toxin-antitoxin module
MAKRQICVQVDEEIAKRMEEIREKTGIPVSRQIELRLKGFKIVEDEERTFGHLFDDDKRLAEVRKRWDEAFGEKTAMDILHRKDE